MGITLSPHVEQQVRRWIERGPYPDADAVIEQALQALAAQEQTRLRELRELVRAGFESGDGGELTPALWDAIAREADEADRQGLPIRREVQP